MKHLIRRDSPHWHDLSEQIKEALNRTIVPSWFEETKHENRFLFRFLSAVGSLTRDLVREELYLIGKFNPLTCDITQPFFYEVYTDDRELFLGRYKRVDTEAELVDDTFREGRIVPVLGDELKAEIQTLQEKISRSEYSYFTEEHLDLLKAKVLKGERLFRQLRPTEVFLSGVNRFVTSHGRVFAVDENGITEELRDERITREVVVDSPYVLIKGIVVRESVRFYEDTETEIPATLGLENAFLGYFDDQDGYDPAFDIDGDGFISQDDLVSLENSVGKNVNNTTEEEWASKYARLDIDGDGKISSFEVEHCRKLVGKVLEPTFVFRRPGSGAVKVVFEEYTQPLVTFATPEGYIRSGVLDFQVLLDRIGIDRRVASGYITNQNGTIIGYNLDRGEIWTGRKSANSSRWYLEKVIYPMMNLLTVVGMTAIDNVVFFLLRPSRAILPTRPLFLLRVDASREKVEVSEDLIPVYGQLETGEEPTGIISSDRKDLMYVATNRRIIGIRLYRNAIFGIAPEQFLVTDSTLLLAGRPQPIKRGRIYNDLDQLAYALGYERHDGQSNEQLVESLIRYVSSPPGHSAQGIIDGFSLRLGTYRTLLWKEPIIRLANVIDKEPNRCIIRISYRPVYRNIVSSYTLVSDNSPPAEVLESEEKEVFVGTNITLLTEPKGTETVYLTSMGCKFVRNLLYLSKDLCQALWTDAFRDYPETILKAPNYDEDLVWFENIQVEVMYSALDGDGKSHVVTEEHKVSLPSLDIMRHSSVQDLLGAYSQISPNSKTGQLVPRVYQMIQPSTVTYIGLNKWNSKIEEIRQSDNSSWDRTVIDLTLYDDKHTTDYIIEPRVADVQPNNTESILVEVEPWGEG